jgi:hypothetical protein
MNKKYRVTLTDEERQRLLALVSNGSTAARRISRELLDALRQR